MDILLKGGNVFKEGIFENEDIAIINGEVFKFGSIPSDAVFDREIDCKGMMVIPGFVDVHVHLREPGFFHKETIRTGTMTAASSGYSAVCSMPNLDPPPVDIDSLKVQLDIIKKDACIKVYPFGAITSNQSGAGELSDMETMAPYVCGFSDDGKGVQTGELMEEAMIKAAKLGKVISAHCEDESLLDDGYINKGKYARENGHRGINSESEWKQVERDIALCKKTGCSYHVCHVSTKESVEIIRQAKKAGIDVTCETAPHYLVFSDNELKETGRFKMNPPIRGIDDREALIKGLIDGTVDMIATDHAPHAVYEKNKGLENSAFGVVGLETAFPILNAKLVLKGVLSIEKLIELMAVAPRKRFNLKDCDIRECETADIAVIDPEFEYVIDPGLFHTKGRSTPFEGMNAVGRCIMNIVNGKIVWDITDNIKHSNRAYKEAT